MSRINRYPKLYLLSTLVLLASVLLSCLPATGEPVAPTVEDSPAEPKPVEGPGSKVLQSSVERDLSPDVSEAELGELVAGNSDFAWDFYQAVREQDGNLFYSPYSISAALAMTYAGAREDTELQVAQTLNFNLPQEMLHPAFNALDLQLASLAESVAADDENQPFQLNIANSLWAQVDYPFLPEFIDLMGLNYGAGLRLVDFVSDAESARVEINDWVADKTAGRIKDLIPEGALNVLTRLVLANAIYFKADWSDPFEKELTSDSPFTLLDGSQVEVPMMSHDEPARLPYLAGDGYQAVELPYFDETTSMLIFVPDAGEFAEFEAGLDRELVERALENLEVHSIDLTMPKFSFESKYSLKDTLVAMGMVDAFDENLADFSGMDGTQRLLIDEVFHKAFVAVDEKGTEAAAATAVVVRAESAPMIDVELTIDRPFVFLIQDKTSGSTLFIGRVMYPQL